MFGRNQKPINDPRAEHQRKKTVFFERLAGKLNGAEDRKVTAQAKRERKAEKRARDAFTAACEAQRSRDYLDGKAYAEVKP